MICRTTCITLIVIFVYVKSDNLRIPMKNFEPTKIHGFWYGWIRTEGLFDTATACCVVDFVHKAGDAYRATFSYVKRDNKSYDQVMDVTDNSVEKAIFTFENDAHKVAMTILDTDYENYMMLYALLGSGPQGVYYFGGRKAEMAQGLREKFDAAIEKNEIRLKFFDVRQVNCPNITRSPESAKA